MAVAILSPWPAATATVTLAAARTCLRTGLRAPVPDGYDPADPATPQPRLSDGRIDAFGSAASALVERYASAAPQAVRNEAVIRLAGWMQTSITGDYAVTGVGGITMTWRPTVSRNALRSSGAMGLLSPWHRPRAMILEEST